MVTITALGYVTDDPQLKLSQKGRTYSSFVLAVQQGYGETFHTMYLQCWAFDTQAELLSRMRIRKGSCLQISGDLDDVEYRSEEGIRHILKVKLYQWKQVLPTTRMQKGSITEPAGEHNKIQLEELEITDTDFHV